MKHLPLALLGALALPLLPAQDRIPPAAAVPTAALTAAAARVPIHDEGHDPVFGPLGVWAAGRDYKCGFVDGGFVLIPYLGAEAPCALPWRWQTTHVSLGGHDLLGGGECREAHTDFRFTRARGAVTEQWDVGEAGVEQSFVVERPAGRLAGGLQLRGHITTPLTAAPRAAAVAPLSFFDAASGYRLDYGVATAIDAEGRRCAVPSSFDGESITLHVPADFVATASWPLLVDPLLQPFVVTTGSSWSFGELDLDAIAGDTAAQELALVWSRAASAADHDLYVFRSSGDFATSTQLGTELTATASSREGSITGSWIDRSIAVAWTRSGSVASQCVVKTMAANTTANTLSGAVVLPHPAGTNERRPQIGAAKVSNFSPAQALVVRLRDTGNGTELWGTIVGTSNNQTYGTFPIAQPSPTSDSIDEPSLTKNLRGDYEGWVLAYQYWSVAASRWQVAVKRVNYIGQVDGGAVVLDGSNPSRHLMRPRIDGSFDRYLVVCSSAPVATYPGQLTSFAGTALEAQRIDWTATAPPTQPWPRQTVRTATARNLLADAVACSTENYSHWLVGVRQGSFARALLLGYRGALVGDEQLPSPAGLGTQVAQDVMVAFSPQHARFALLYDHTTSYQGNVGWTCQGIVRAYDVIPEPVQYGGVCGLGPLHQYGDARIGNQFVTIGPSGLQPGTWVIAGVSLGSANVPFAAFGVPGGCSLRIDHGPQHLLGTFFLNANGAGYAGFDLPLPENLPPLDLFVQFVGAGATPGSLVASRGVQLFVR